MVVLKEPQIISNPQAISLSAFSKNGKQAKERHSVTVCEFQGVEKETFGGF
jgi:hypothetical protein